MKLVPDDLEAFLGFDDVVSVDSAMQAKTEGLVCGLEGDVEIARGIFEWVRDEVPHSKDLGAEVVTCSAVEAFSEGTGICFAKSHLVAAMMRLVGIPCGFCYQVFENEVAVDAGTMALHGLNAIYLESTGRWHRIDPRGNRDGIVCEFSVEGESLPFPEMEFLDDCVYAVPLADVVEGLRKATSIAGLWPVLPSV